MSSALFAKRTVTVPPGAVYVLRHGRRGRRRRRRTGADGPGPPLLPDEPFDPPDGFEPLPDPGFGPRFPPPVVGTPGAVVAVECLGVVVVVGPAGRVVEVECDSRVVDVDSAATSTRRCVVEPFIAAAIPATPSTDSTATDAIAAR